MRWPKESLQLGRLTATIGVSKAEHRLIQISLPEARLALRLNQRTTGKFDLASYSGVKEETKMSKKIVVSKSASPGHQRGIKRPPLTVRTKKSDSDPHVLANTAELL